MKRKKFSARDLEKLLERFDRKCRMCQCAINGASGLEWDHRIPLAIGGEDALDNLEPLCIRCHRTKTKSDVKRIAKTNRQRQRNLGVRKPKGTIQNRGRAEPKPSKPLPERKRPIYADTQKAS